MGIKNKKRRPSYICTIADQEEVKYALDALYVLNGKWRMPLIIAIYNGNHRYREIAKNIPGITFAMLSKELKHMELNNLALRIEDPDFLMDVEYGLTEYCESLYPLVENLITWGQTTPRRNFIPVVTLLLFPQCKLKVPLTP